MPTCCAQCSSSSLGGEAASVCVDCGSATIAGVVFSAPSLLGVAALACGLVFVLPKLRLSAWRLAGIAANLLSGNRAAGTI